MKDNRNIGIFLPLKHIETYTYIDSFLHSLSSVVFFLSQFFILQGSREGRLGEKTVVVTSNPIKNTATMDIWKYSNVKNGGSYILRVDRIKYSRP